MKEIIITSISIGGSGGEDRLTENVTLNFAEYKTEYAPQKPDGSGDAAVEAAFNIAENAKV
jgi:type VI secretion system secreted protein Hcp